MSLHVSRLHIIECAALSPQQEPLGARIERWLRDAGMQCDLRTIRYDYAAHRALPPVSGLDPAALVILTGGPGSIYAPWLDPLRHWLRRVLAAPPRQRPLLFGSCLGMQLLSAEMCHVGVRSLRERVCGVHGEPPIFYAHRLRVLNGKDHIRAQGMAALQGHPEFTLRQMAAACGRARPTRCASASKPGIVA